MICKPNSQREAARTACGARGRSELAFTIIEIAICLGVIGFALVAIIGILPSGMTVQKDNRQETIVNQDASIFMEAIRDGAQGVDDLTNYVDAITNYWTFYNNGTPGKSGYDGYTYTNSDVSSYNASFPITFGNRIIGLLSAPKYTDVVINGNSVSFQSNYVVAYVRAISGNAELKYPQKNSEALQNSFAYRMVSEVVPYAYYDPSWTNYGNTNVILPPGQSNTLFNAAMILRAQQNNLYDLRLLFRWPLFQNGEVGAGRQAFRTITGGFLMRTNDGGYPSGVSNIFLFQPRTYVKPT